MEFSVGAIFGVLNFSKSAAEYLKIIESLDMKLERLAQSELEAGMRELEQASKSITQQESLLQAARGRFNKAISLEKDERLALCYSGLAFCHYHLQDFINAKDALQDLLKVEIDTNNLEGVFASVYQKYDKHEVLLTLFPSLSNIMVKIHPVTTILARIDPVTTIPYHFGEFSHNKLMKKAKKLEALKSFARQAFDYIP